jgi:hypothetical protein
MMNKAMLSGLVALVGLLPASAEEFPLTFRTVPAKDVMTFPGGFGASEMLSSSRPARLRREPKVVSQHPLYSGSRAVLGGASVLVRLDESKGDGRGYDQLIVDMNQNGDLTDDPVVQLTEPTTTRSRATPRQLLFGPIQSPADKALVGGRPQYFAEVYLYNSQVTTRSSQAQNLTYGQFMLKAGWYLDATVTVDGTKWKVGVYDGDANQHLGDFAKSQVITNRGSVSWYFRNADSWLLKRDAAGGFADRSSANEMYPFGPFLYVGAKAYKMVMAPDCRSLRVEPWSEPLAEVALQPQGDQVRSITLAWEQPGGRWQLLRPAVAAGGKVQVPSGNYRLYACNIVGEGAARDRVTLSATRRAVLPPVSVAAGRNNTLACGAPLDVAVTAVKARPYASRLQLGEAAETAASSESELRINAVVTGAGGEIYSTFQKGERPDSKPAPPVFTITDAAGKQLAKGNLEYG